MNEFKVTRETYRSRLKRGWCVDRASGVVPISTSVKQNDRVPTHNFLFIRKLVRISNASIMPRFTAWCECGEPMTVTERDLFIDLNCGCKQYGTTPKKLDMYAEMESNKDFIEYCEKMHKAVDASSWRAFRHNKQ